MCHFAVIDEQPDHRRTGQGKKHEHRQQERELDGGNPALIASGSRVDSHSRLASTVLVNVSVSDTGSKPKMRREEEDGTGVRDRVGDRDGDVVVFRAAAPVTVTSVGVTRGDALSTTVVIADTFG